VGGEGFLLGVKTGVVACSLAILTSTKDDERVWCFLVSRRQVP
jgi:hypothetical protein